MTLQRDGQKDRQFVISHYKYNKGLMTRTLSIFPLYNYSTISQLTLCLGSNELKTHGQTFHSPFSPDVQEDQALQKLLGGPENSDQNKVRNSLKINLHKQANNYSQLFQVLHCLLSIQEFHQYPEREMGEMKRYTFLGFSSHVYLWSSRLHYSNDDSVNSKMHGNIIYK